MSRAARAAAGSAGALAATAAVYWGIGAVMVPPLRGLAGGQVLSDVRTARRLVALTFDDGPDPELVPGFLQALGGAPATFFVLGESVRRSPDAVRAIAAAGHEVACHGDDHVSLAHRLPAATVVGLRRARDSVAGATGRPPRYFRPPYGFFNGAAWAAAPRLGMRRTLWTAWARDWEPEATAERTSARILRAARPGAILLLHDARGRSGAPRRTMAAVPRILEGLSRRDLRPVTLSELVAAGRRTAP